jgi:hypothetical protein
MRLTGAESLMASIDLAPDLNHKDLSYGRTSWPCCIISFAQQSKASANTSKMYVTLTFA